MNNFKTTMLLATLIVILVLLGDAFGGARGMMLMFIISAGMSIASYWYSDKIVLAQYNAQQVTAQSNPKLYGMVEQLAKNGKLPMPKVYIIPTDVPNAFATGRNPEHAAVAVTAGIQRLLTDDELAGVLGHELTHVKNRDTLISTIAAIIGGAISTIAHFGMFFGGRSDDRDDNVNPLALIGMVILAPIAAAIIQVELTLSGSSSLTGMINITENADGGTAVDDNAVVTVEEGSTWTLTGDCTITSLTNNGTIDFNGHTITLADGTVLSE